MLLFALKPTLENIVQELRERGMSIYFHSNGELYSINKGDSEPTIWFEGSSICYIRGDSDGIILAPPIMSD